MNPEETDQLTPASVIAVIDSSHNDDNGEATKILATTWAVTVVMKAMMIPFMTP